MNEWKITDVSGRLFEEFKGSLNKAMQRAEDIARKEGTKCVVRDKKYNRLAAVPDFNGGLVPIKSKEWIIGSRSYGVCERLEGTIAEAMERADELAHYLGQDQSLIDVFEANGGSVAARVYRSEMNEIVQHKDPIRCYGNSGFYGDWLQNNRLIQNNGDGTYLTVASGVNCHEFGAQTVGEWVDDLVEDETLIPIDYSEKKVTPDMPDYVDMDRKEEPKIWRDRLIID